MYISVQILICKSVLMHSLISHCIHFWQWWGWGFALPVCVKATHYNRMVLLSFNFLNYVNFHHLYRINSNMQHCLTRLISLFKLLHSLVLMHNTCHFAQHHKKKYVLQWRTATHYDSAVLTDSSFRTHSHAHPHPPQCSTAPRYSTGEHRAYHVPWSARSRQYPT